MHRVRKLKYYQVRAAQIRTALSQDGLNEEYRRWLHNALYLAENRIRRFLKADDSENPTLN